MSYSGNVNMSGAVPNAAQKWHESIRRRCACVTSALTPPTSHLNQFCLGWVLDSGVQFTGCFVCGPQTEPAFPTPSLIPFTMMDMQESEYTEEYPLAFINLRLPNISQLSVQ